MPWLKDVKSEKPRIVYRAPASGWPVKRIIFDPRPNQPRWMLEFAWLHEADDAILTIERMMGL